jgi:hypothetical protein
MLPSSKPLASLLLPLCNNKHHVPKIYLKSKDELYIYITNMRATIIHIKITKHIINPLHSSKPTQKYIIEKTKKINMFGMKE